MKFNLEDDVLTLIESLKKCTLNLEKEIVATPTYESGLFSGQKIAFEEVISHLERIISKHKGE